MGDTSKPAHERTLREFVGKNPEISKVYGRWNEESFILHRIPYLKDYEIKARNILCTKPQRFGTSDPNITRMSYYCFHLAVLKEDPEYALLLAEAIDAETGKVWIPAGVVGEFYREAFGNILGIMEAYRGYGAGAHFVAAAIEVTGNVEPSGAYSPAGLATRKKAHRILVENAIKRGDSVPMEVLKEYEKKR